MSITLSLAIIAINLYLVIDTIKGEYLHWAILAGIGCFRVLYFAFCVYLIIHMVVFMGGSALLRSQFIKDYVIGPVDLDFSIEPSSE